MSDGSLRIEPHGTVLVARMVGEIDLSNAERLRGDIAEATSPGVRHVVLDLTEVAHMDSYGIFVIHGLRQRLRDHETGLVLIIPKDGRVRRTIELARVPDVIPVKETLEDALSAFG